MGFVQELAHGSSTGSGATWAISLSATPSASNRVILILRTPTAGTVSSVTDSQGNTWHVTGTTLTTPRPNAAICYTDQDVAPLVSGNSITVTYAATATSQPFDVLEYSGLGPIRSTANVGVNPANTTGTISAFAMTAGDLVITTLAAISGTITAYPSGFTARGSYTVSPGPADFTVATTGSANLTYSWTTSDPAALLAVAFEPAGTVTPTGLLAFL